MISGRTSRFVPFLIALTLCATTAVILGFGAWYLFGKNPIAVANSRAKMQPGPGPADDASRAAANGSETKEQPNNTTPSASLPGTVAVTSATVEIGGTGSTAPAQRVAVNPFLIAETEVTNWQYQEFLKETGHKAPNHWKDGEMPPGAANEPATGVKWQDAVDYCQWLSTKIGATVRLPSEAEWELAARGPESLKYPWGNEWDNRAAASEQHSGFVHAVKSYPAGRSPVGAYDMAGNVWEWIGEALDHNGNSVLNESSNHRVIKGGAANEHQALISATSRNVIPKEYAGAFLGFRYVVEQK